MVCVTALFAWSFAVRTGVVTGVFAGVVTKSSTAPGETVTSTVAVVGCPVESVAV